MSPKSDDHLAETFFGVKGPCQKDEQENTCFRGDKSTMD